jgi:outer membrane protein assembly factor BamB
MRNWLLNTECARPRVSNPTNRHNGTRTRNFWIARQCIAALLVGMLFCGTGSLTAVADPGTWPQWRGPKRDGSVNAGAWPDSLQEPALKQRWRVEFPPSYSGPVVSNDKVFVTYTKDEKFEGVCALDRESGKQVWTAEWEGAMNVADVSSSMGSWIRATPAYDGKSLFVAGMPDVLVCLDANTGAERWRADFHKRYATPLPEVGFVCSPLAVDDGVYVQTADSFVKVDKQTGDSVWRCLERHEKVSEEGMGQGSYSSPDFAVIHGRPQLLVANIDAIAGVDPSTGTVLWKRVLDSYDRGCILAPIAYRDGIFTSTRASRTGHYPLIYRDGQFTITDGWKNKLTVYMSSPVVVGDFAYVHLANERFACIDLRDGKINWISDPVARYCSLAWCKDRILALTNDGELLLIHADPNKFVLADSRQISTEETWGYLAIAGADIYIRERNAIAAYRWQ